MPEPTHSSTLTRTSTATTAAAGSGAPGVIVHTLADLVCHLCGSLAGAIQSDLPSLPRTVRFVALGSDRAVVVLDWHRLRCARCNGTLFAEEIRTVRERPEPQNLWDDERPRRGRPPKWLVEQRQREREEFERLTEAA